MMIEYKEIVVPIVVAVISAVITAIITIKIKYAPTEKEAISGLKGIGKKILYYCWIGWLIYSLVKEFLSGEPLTRITVFNITILTVSLVALIFMYFINRTVDALNNIVDLQGKHFELTNHIVALYKDTKASPNQTNPADANNNTAD
jgi:hypothetical protein